METAGNTVNEIVPSEPNGKNFLHWYQVVPVFVISRPGQWSVTRRPQTIVASVFV